MPKKFENTVQSDFNRHSSQSSQFGGRTDDDLFYSVGGKGSGKWVFTHDRAEAWLRKKSLGD